MHRDETAIVGLVMSMVFGLPFLGCMLWMLCHYAFLFWKQGQATSLVRDMVARGYTAQEIIQMCQALGHKKAPPFPAATDVPPAKPVKQPAYSP